MNDKQKKTADEFLETNEGVATEESVAAPVVEGNTTDVEPEDTPVVEEQVQETESEENKPNAAQVVEVVENTTCTACKGTGLKNAELLCTECNGTGSL